MNKLRLCTGESKIENQRGSTISTITKDTRPPIGPTWSGVERVAVDISRYNKVVTIGAKV